MSFTDLGLNENILRALGDQGYTEPTPIQQQAIPLIMEGRDLMGGAQTGTGKTAGFTLPLLHRLLQHPAPKSRPVRALILTPTRELAAQVAQSVATYGKYLKLRSTVVYGGASMHTQKANLRKGVDILIATPGRLLDHLGQKTLNLSQLEMLVLDEADRMLDMGFIHDIRRLLHFLPQKRQTLLFSATFSKEIKKLAADLLRDPAHIEVAPSNTSAETITQLIHPVDRKKKSEMLIHLIQEQQWKQALVFTRTKHGANRLTQELEDAGIRASAIHGNKTQNARMQALSKFKQGKVRVLVATDIAARGLDIAQLPYVVNFELPCVPEDYVHRIGRTGRAGREGKALSLVCVDEHKLLREIERLLDKELPKETVAGFEPDPSIKAEPILRGRGGGFGKRPSAKRGGPPGKPAGKRTDKRRPFEKKKQKPQGWGRSQRRKAGV